MNVQVPDNEVIVNYPWIETIMKNSKVLKEPDWVAVSIIQDGKPFMVCGKSPTEETNNIPVFAVNHPSIKGVVEIMPPDTYTLLSHDKTVISKTGVTYTEFQLMKQNLH